MLRRFLAKVLLFATLVFFPLTVAPASTDGETWDAIKLKIIAQVMLLDAQDYLTMIVESGRHTEIAAELAPGAKDHLDEHLAILVKKKIISAYRVEMIVEGKHMMLASVWFKLTKKGPEKRFKMRFNFADYIEKPKPLPSI